MDYKTIEKRLQAAQTIFQADSLNRATFDSLKTILSGVHPKIDKALGEVGKAFKHVDQIQNSDVVELIAEGLPETTPQDKKRKKVILLFLKFWNDLKSEVSRVEKEVAEGKAHGQQPASAISRVFSVMKGPLGIVTLVAVGIVALRMTEVSVMIKNVGCQPMNPITSVTVNIPGLKLPNETIPDGGLATVKLPPLRVAVDATSSNLVRLAMYGMTYDFELESSGIRLVFDGETLNGKHTSINLASQKEHTLMVVCK